MDPNLQAFHSQLRTLINLEYEDLVAAGIVDDAIEFRRFEDNPTRFFIRASDARVLQLWNLITSRQPAPYQIAAE